jgi:hypothetical protein
MRRQIRDALSVLLGGVLFAASVIALLWAAALLEVTR